MALPPSGSGTITIDPSSDLSLGGSVTFEVNYPGKLKNPRVFVTAYQEDDLVYGEAGTADHVFVLGGNPDRGSEWVVAGGPAACRADLFYFATGNHEWNGNGQQEVVTLASVAFLRRGN